MGFVWENWSCVLMPLLMVRVFHLWRVASSHSRCEVLSVWLDISHSFSSTRVSAEDSTGTTGDVNWQGCMCPRRAWQHMRQLSHVVSRKCMKLHLCPSSRVLRSNREVAFPFKFKMFASSDQCLYQRKPHLRSAVHDNLVCFSSAYGWWSAASPCECQLRIWNQSKVLGIRISSCFWIYSGIGEIPGGAETLFSEMSACYCRACKIVLVANFAR